MVKLVRLTSNDDCKFNADLDSGILVGENTQIALQNLTTQTIFPTLTINASNKQLRTNLDTDTFDSAIQNLSERTYTLANHTDFFVDLESTLNDTMRIQGNIPAAFENHGDVFRSTRIDYPNRTPISDEKIQMETRFTQVIMPFVRNDDLDDRAGTDQEVFLTSNNGTVSVDVDPSGADPNDDYGNMSLTVGVQETSIRKHFITTFADDIMFSRGCGIWGCRVQNIWDNLLPDANTNGFGIGLSFHRTKSTDTEILNTNRDFEIRCKRPTDNYTYISPSVPNTEQDTGLAPYSMITSGGGGGVDNDQLVFWRDGSNLHFQIWNRDGEVEGKVAWSFTHVLTKYDQSRPLYPYIYICGDSSGAPDGLTDTIVGQPYITLDPFMDGNDDYDVTGNTQVLSSTGENVLANLSNMTNVTPLLNNDKFDLPSNLNNTYLWRMHVDVWRLLGFDINKTSGHYDYSPIPIIQIVGIGSPLAWLRVTIIADNTYALVNTDNFVVVIDSNPVVSYDASRFDYGSNIITQSSQNIHRGRRQNILATIPVNDNTGILEYRANELVYIDLDNNFPQIIKNLRLRVLNKNFEEIQTSGMSVMTLLIKD